MTATAVGLFVSWQTQSLSFVISYTLGKAIINGLIGWLHHYQKDSELAYYNNLGIPTPHLYAGAFLVDLAIWILLILLIP